uniref:ZP domain-containing protein n=1 Tax=Athene cunicularia TaxID=194338 RepID=A0A663LY53_ATHCN
MTVSGGPPNPLVPLCVCEGYTHTQHNIPSCLPGTWSSRLHQPTYFLGELVNIEASVSTDPRLPLRVFVDECVASPSTATWLKYKVIADNGCLLDEQLGRSRFLPQSGDSFLRFQLDTFLFPNASNNQIYLHCHLKAVVEGTGSTSGKSCSYDRMADAWRSPDGANCSCCGSPAGCGGRRRRQLAGSRGRKTLLNPWGGMQGPMRCLCPAVPDGLLLTGLLGEASILLSPLGLVSALPSLSPAPTGLLKALEPSTALPRRPSVPVVREEKRDSGECELPHGAGGWWG